MPWYRDLEVLVLNIISKQTFDEERALYGSVDLQVEDCKFDGPADGESAFKECENINVKDSYFNLRYPFWHVNGLKITGSEMTELCRAALWYCEDIEITDSKLHGIKALRECQKVTMKDCDIVSPEFGWSTHVLNLENVSLEGEYVFMRATELDFKSFKLKGKYSFQYIENAVFENCEFDTKDAFWHGKNITVRNSVIKGEYFAWYSENLTLENCKIIGTQPLCYCKGLKLINCEMEDADLAFEKSEVEADVITPVISIKNPATGYVAVPAVEEIIYDDPKAKGKIIIDGKEWNA